MRRIICHYPIIFRDSKIGYIQLIKSVGELPEVEYDLDDIYWNRGVMTRELSLYLDYLREKGFTTLRAFVRENNLASKRVLKKNGFYELRGEKVDDLECFIIHLNLIKKNVDN